MHVIATAGHVDHGKSTLVRALTGTDPDRLEEEHRRGLSIQLGYCWTRLDGAGDVAFVDVPGHERFVATMLSGVGPVPAVLFVVAADDPWMPQAAEHLAALDALGVSRGVLAVSRCDLADPAPALARARHELDRTTLRGAPTVAVSGRTGQGLDELRHLLRDLVGSLPQPTADADVRLWVDRCFHVRGAGTVVTGTLPAGRIALGDTLLVASGSGGVDRLVRVRRIECLGRAMDAATGVARVALNVAGAGLDELDRSSVLVTPGAWQPTDLVDVRLQSGTDRAAASDGRKDSRLNTESATAQRGKPHGSTGMGTGMPPERGVVHIGATSVPVHVRPLGAGTARVRLDRALPLRIGDRALLRDPGSRRVWGLTVLDPAPTSLPSRRGAAAELGRRLAALDGTPDLADELRRRGTVHLPALRRIGVDLGDADRVGMRVGEWLLDDEQVSALRERLDVLVAEHDRRDPVHPGVPETELAHELGVPTLDVLAALVRPPLRRVDGRVTREQRPALPAPLERALAAVEADLGLRPFAAPTADRLRELGLDTRAIAAAVKADRLLRLAPGIVLLPGADAAALARLAELPQPFTTSEARIRLDTSRRVVLPLLERLDRAGLTERLPDDRRAVRPAR